MSKKKSTSTTTNLPALRIGSRIRCTDDGVTGRIVWANAVSVKITWDDGEQVTWKRDSLATRPIEILDPDAQTETPTEPTPVEQVAETAANAEPALEAKPETPAVEQELGVPAANPLREQAAPAADALAGPDARPDWEVALEAARPAAADADAPTAERSAEMPAEAPAKPKRQRKAKTPAEPKVKKPSALDAAAKVLGEAGTAMTCKEMIGAMAAKGYWTSPGGKTPDATLCSAILREINVKGERSRFVKAAPGRFALRPTA
jgi:hypothetical protein